MLLTNSHTVRSHIWDGMLERVRGGEREGEGERETERGGGGEGRERRGKQDKKGTAF